MIGKRNGNMGAMRHLHEKHDSQMGLAQFEDEHKAVMAGLIPDQVRELKVRA
jgi:hypothetical protein